MSSATEILLLHIRANDLPTPQQEVQFCPGRKFRFDLCWPDRMLALEIEGGTWVYGRHQRPETYERDCIKYSKAAILGWRVIRVTTDMVQRGQALELLLEAFKQ